MSLVNNLEDQLYMPIIEQFKKDKIDYEFIGKIIVDICNKLDIKSVNINPKTIMKNALLLVLGLIYKDEPIETYGDDISELDRSTINKIRKEIKDILNDYQN